MSDRPFVFILVNETFSPHSARKDVYIVQFFLLKSWSIALQPSRLGDAYGKKVLQFFKKVNVTWFQLLHIKMIFNVLLTISGIVCVSPWLFLCHCKLICWYFHSRMYASEVLCCHCKPEFSVSHQRWKKHCRSYLDSVTHEWYVEIHFIVYVVILEMIEWNCLKL